MKLAKILIVTIVMSVVFTLSIDARYRYSSKVEQSVPKYPDRSHIYPGECVDTLIRLKNEGNVTLPWIFEQVAPLQVKGRDSLDYEYDLYDFKIGKFLVSLPPIQDYVININDTVFIVEIIGETGTYTIKLWEKSADSLIRINESGRYSVENVNNSRENKYIRDWQKDTLQTYGCCEQLEGFWRSNTSTRSVTRVILRTDSVFLEMFKYYNPWWPEDLK
ncbi:MAG: hypothetical protein NC212_01470 [Staphylococcus sp.]|nr:hypothetical protein [Staphylococcus sp.]